MPAQSAPSGRRFLRRCSSALSVVGEIDPQNGGLFFWEVDELLGERELRLEPVRSLLELCDAPVLRVELRLAAGLVRRQGLAAVERQLLAPCRQMGAVDALAPEQPRDVAALRASSCLANKAQLLGRGERPPPAGLRKDLDGDPRLGRNALHDGDGIAGPEGFLPTGEGHAARTGSSALRRR